MDRWKKLNHEDLKKVTGGATLIELLLLQGIINIIFIHTQDEDVVMAFLNGYQNAIDNQG